MTMQDGGLFLAAIAGLTILALVGSPGAAAGKRWTLATDDTILAIGRDDKDSVAILELKNHAQQLNWIDKPSPILLMNRVEFGGQSIAPDWAFRSAVIDKSDGTKLTLLFASATPKLELRSEWWARPGAGPIRHAEFITNQSGGPVKIPYHPSLAVQLISPQAGAPAGKNENLWLWYFHSDGGTPDPQGVYREQITEKLDRTVRTHPDGALIPLVVLDLEGRHGVYVGVEWSFADIRLTGLPSPSPPGATVLAGNVLDFQTQLQAGQVFEVPPAFIGAYDGDIDNAGNSLRKYLFRYNVPEILRRDATYPKVQWNAFGATGKSPSSWDPVESKYYPLIDDIAPLGFEEVMIDVGWWQGAEPEPDPVDWPSGMKKAAEYAHQKGMRFGLYWSDDKNMALPAERKVRIERIKSLFGKQGADMWRSDATSGLVIAQDYWSVAGFYQLIEVLQHDIRNFQWENCSGGGRIKDYGAMQRCVKIFNSDTYSPLDVRRAFYDSSFAFHPIQLEGHLGSPDGRYRPQGIAGMRYAFRCMSMGAPEWFLDAPNGGNGCDPWTAEEKEAVKAAAATYKTKIRPLVRNANLYHIFPRPDDRGWDGIEYYDPATGKGVVFLFKPDSPNDTQAVKLKGLEADQTYRLTFEDGSNSPQDKSGTELLGTGIDVTLKGKFVSELMFFERKDGPCQG
jgi:hypothetical protein